LESITLRGLRNVYLTEETLFKLLVKNCELTGEITIVNSVGSTTPKGISFLTKQELVNKFGDITKGTNGLKINFKEINITQSFSYNSIVSAYYNTNIGGTQSFSNLFGVNAKTGNNVIIISEKNPFNPSVIGFLDISYTMPDIENASIDTYTGTITLTGPVLNDVDVTITMKTLSGLNITGVSKVQFTWKAPTFGDFAYADGTFSSYYNQEKTLIGLVYSRIGDSNSGTVYIIGKEYANIP
jgi:hypothetical protein